MEHLSALVLKNAGHKVLYTFQNQLLSLNLILFNSKKGGREKTTDRKRKLRTSQMGNNGLSRSKMFLRDRGDQVFCFHSSTSVFKNISIT